MSQLIIFALALIAILTLPVMLAARTVGAERTGFGSAILAAILQTVASVAIRHFVHEPLIAVVTAIIVASIIYAFVLGTSILKSFLVGIITTVVSIVAIILLAASFAVIANAA